MTKLTIDQHEIEVPAGTTILEAARKLGIEIPTLCYVEGRRPPTSCLVCIVKVAGHQRLVPSCATVVEEGMRIESETEEVRGVRKSALELLLSDHLGDCVAPCWSACPANMDIPQMLRQIAAGDMRGAIVTVKRDIALPAVLGRICPAPCEKACRRGGLDGAVAICQLKRVVADVDLASGNPYRPACQAPSGQRVAIVGAGPTGLAAAYYLSQQGHACVLFDDQDKPGGRLLVETTPEELPRDVLDAEINIILGPGIELRPRTRVGREVSLDELRAKFGAVLIAAGATAKGQAAGWGLPTAARGVEVQRETYQTSVAGVFAAGSAVRGKAMVVRSVADGKEAAVAIGQYLAGGPVTGAAETFTTRIGRMERPELVQLATTAATVDAAAASAIDAQGGDGLPSADSRADAARCLHCDCRKLHTCRLRKYAAEYGADPKRYRAQRRPFQQDARHGQVIYEPGKCIACGLCVQIAQAAGEPLGLAFVGRGFDVRVGVPFSRPLEEALRKVATQCIAACPTAALAWKDAKANDRGAFEEP